MGKYNIFVVGDVLNKLDKMSLADPDLSDFRDEVLKILNYFNTRLAASQSKYEPICQKCGEAVSDCKCVVAHPWMLEAAQEINRIQLSRGHIIIGQFGIKEPIMTAAEQVDIIAKHFSESERKNAAKKD